MKRLLVLSSLFALAACQKGPSGDPGPAGPVGPIGPAMRAPEILSVTPEIGSPSTTIELEVAYLGSAAGVTFDGDLGNVISQTMVSATSAHLRVTGLPAGASNGWGFSEISVVWGGRTSVPAAIDLAPAGTTRVATRGTLLEPRGMALAADGSVLIFDLEAGVLRRDAAGTSVLHPATLATGALSTGTTAGDVIYAGGTGGRIVAIAADGTVSLIANGLTADAVQIAVDAAGDVYWTDGTAQVKKRDPGAGVVTFATLPEPVSGLVRIANGLYASGASGDLHRIALADATTSVLAPGVGTGPLAVDGNDVIACVNDAGGTAAVRVTTAGVATNVALPHGFAVASGSHGCAVSGGVLWTISDRDESLASATLGGGNPWAVRDVSLDDEGRSAGFVGDRLVLAARNRCSADAPGALVEVAPSGAVRALASDLCPAAFAAEPAGTLLVLEARDAAVVRVDPSTGAQTPLLAGGAVGGVAIVSAPDGSFFVAREATAVSHYGPTGVELAADIAGLTATPVAMVFGGGELWVASSDEIVRVPFDAQGTALAPAPVVEPFDGFAGIVSVAHDGAELYFSLGGGEVFAADAGGVRWVDDVGPLEGIAFTPYGELLLLNPTAAFPMARLP